ncbi:hypothetical protein [Sphingopyxis sp.]|uniref:hypothetical protein n=1 Tax=Sphingopyxis sp. TaxID=1908224 RepID=UPI001D25FCDF|nr:hypothetical protein [Sphingopyxis sp.]MBW8296568.1 hypothetical protein [Sphingopyxis sp.]
MKDELWMRTWDDGRPRFSDDLHDGLLWLVARFRRIGGRVMRRTTTVESTPAPVPRPDAA